MLQPIEIDEDEYDDEESEEEEEEYESDDEDEGISVEDEGLEDETPKTQMVKPDFTMFWVALMIGSIFFLLMDASTLYLSIHAWSTNNNVNRQIFGVKENIAAANRVPDCMSCTDNAGVSTTTIKGIMVLSPPSQPNDQFTTGIILDSVSFAYGNEARSTSSLFLFENNLGASSNLVSLSQPGLINIPFDYQSSLLPCAQAGLVESSIFTRADISDNLFLCICNTTNDFCLTLTAS